MAYPEGDYLAPADFRKRFRSAWDAAQSRFFKIERRQAYNQAGDESFDVYVRGDHEKAKRLLRESVLMQSEMYERARRRGVELVRLRLIEDPLTDYLRYYEIPSYFVSQELGEQICFAEVDPKRDRLPDCIIFDSSVMFVNAYDGLNRPVGAIEVSEGEEIERHLSLAEEMLSSGEGLSDFVQTRSI